MRLIAALSMLAALLTAWAAVVGVLPSLVVLVGRVLLAGAP